MHKDVSFFFIKYCVGCAWLLLLHSSLVANWTKHNRWTGMGVGLSEQNMMKDGGGGIAMVMRVEHARSPLCCIPLETRR